jgi:hypothetical protein
MNPGIKVGDVVQINPEHDERFGACFLVVTELKSWGVQGYARVPGGGDAYYRVPYEQVHLVGVAEWVHQSEAS